jgi:hypothetical protein
MNEKSLADVPGSSFACKYPSLPDAHLGLVRPHDGAPLNAGFPLFQAIRSPPCSRSAADTSGSTAPCAP